MENKDYTLNSKEYWNYRFNENWEKAKGIEQTRYFANLACSLFPEWLIKDVCKNSYDICDLGCAEGDAVPVLQKTFPMCKIHGEDFSENAIEIARSKYSTFDFNISDILNPDKSKKYPVIYSSNTIEHFKNTYEVLSKIESRSLNYTLILMPYREDFEVPEHEVVLGTSDIPLVLGESSLVFAKSVYCNSEYYGREQMLLIYSKDKDVKRVSLLSDCVEQVSNLQQKNMKNDYNKLHDEWQKINDELYISREDLKQLKNDFNELKEEKDKIININKDLLDEKSLLKEEIEDLNNEILNLEGINSEDINSKDDVKEDIREKLIHIDNYLQQINSIKSYKQLLYLRRIKDQLIKGSKSEKKDFIKYTLNRMLKREKYICNDLKYFDGINIARQSLSNVIQNDFNQNVHFKNNITFEQNKKNTSQVYIFAGIPYYDIGGGQRCSQLANTFNKMGYEVHYFYAFDSNESVKFNLQLPTVIHESIDNISISDVFSSIKEEAVFIFEAPYIKFVPYLEKAKKLGIKTIYEHIDNWETSLGSLLYDPKSFESFIKDSDYLIATSIELQKQINKYTEKEVHYLPNAVDITIFEPKYNYECPKDLNIGKEKTLLYFGSLWGEWFDWDLVKNTALECPNSTFNMIGEYSGIPDIVKSMPPNVYFLGLKKQSELPAYLHYSDIAMLPFKNCEIGKYVSPLKIFEYIAMEKQVLATPLPDIIGYPNTICSEDYNEWVNTIKSHIELESTSEFIAANSWYNRCNNIIDISNIEYLKESDYSKNSISIIVLNHNNKSVIFRCIDSLLNHNKNYNYEIIVVDNDSTDGSYELLEERYKDRIILVKNTKNGCSSGRNIGIKHSSGEKLVFIDSDQWVISDRWLDAGIYILQKNKGVGAVSWGAGWFEKNKLRGPIVDYMPNRGILPWQLFRDDVSYLATSGLIMEKKIFELIDGFDEYYDPTCFEDTDLAFQIMDLGLKIAYTPYISLMHLPHQTTKSGSNSHNKLMDRNGMYFKKKWKEKNPAILAKSWELIENIQY
ncbi:glycosyltransferase [Clostridium sp. SM-530-WT-3G]|uniref:glycosyltransferase n=1 Tax=Clostridium sp. SM-530-WT-3G TaxID=2725303 RepID=UPI00145D42AC|nr:glycosyltransferase [Clostridium sp. SM-530-WT-3G]NME83076.1 glycosyltransferase [Clostridium sp. SM-530-WT-3G]